ncbi:MAG: S41 family peptidase [Gammaproteobacteria bacterium]|nr:S41 family peptidase [Gammaproteobacteria bacterium]
MNRISVILLCSALSFSVTALAGKSSSKVPMDQLKAFAETYWQIKNSYVDEVDDKKLLEGAINGMLRSLDPYSGFLGEDDLKDLSATSDGIYDGLGVEVSNQEETVKIVGVVDDSPAERAGLKADDIIVSVDTYEVAVQGAEAVIDAMRGSAGQAVELGVVKQGQEEITKLTLVRETIELASVLVDELDDGMWHVKLRVFQRDSGYELERVLLRAARGKQINGLILDMRDNPGGVLRAAVDVSDLLLSSGTIVSTDGRTEDSKQRYYANPGDPLETVPLVVLINERSASASEIVAGALQDHGRGKIIGQKSFGKGVVQSIVPIRQNAAIKLTTSRYYTPKGRSINGTGIAPDVEVETEQLAAGVEHVDRVVQEAKRQLLAIAKVD